MTNYFHISFTIGMSTIKEAAKMIQGLWCNSLNVLNGFKRLFSPVDYLAQAGDWDESFTFI